MPYATPSDLLILGADQLAQLAEPDDAAVTGDLLRATIDGADRSAWSAEDRTLADEALGRIVKEISSASARIDSYLAPRYPLPLSAELVAGADLRRVCTDLVWYRLHVGEPPKHVADRHRDHIAWLLDVSRGRASLGAQDTATAAPDGRVVARSGVSRIDWTRF